MIIDSQTNFIYFSALLQSMYRSFYNDLENILRRHSISIGVLNNTNDIWCRFTYPDNFSVVIFKERGEGKFRKSSPLGSETINGALYFGGREDIPVLPDNERMLQSKLEILKFIEEKVEKNKQKI